MIDRSLTHIQFFETNLCINAATLFGSMFQRTWWNYFRQFFSKLCEELYKRFGVSNNNTTSYYPQANGAVERMHRQLKVAVMARTTDANLTNHVPYLYLGTRTLWRADLDHSPAELVYVISLRLTGKFSYPSKSQQCQPIIRISETT